MNELQTVNQTRTVGDIKSHVNVIKQILDDVMIKDTHYGVIPGCGTKPALLKAGAEKILATFMLAAEFVIDDLSTEDNKFYRVEARLTHQGTKTFMGSGIGECSSLESKYAWRVAVCEEEYEATPANLRRVHFKKGWQGKPAEKVNQVRQDMYSLSNTILKMAKKRSLIDAVMNVTACSDIFVQDLDEDHLREAAKIPDVPKAAPPKITKAAILAAFKASNSFNALESKWQKAQGTEFKDDAEVIAQWMARKAELANNV